MKMRLLAGLTVLVLILLGVAYFALDPEKNTLDSDEREALGGTYVNLSDGTTHYELAGPDSGKVVVLVHGGTVPMWTWEYQTKMLHEAGFRTLAYDMYGRGYSDRPAIVYDRKLYQRQLLELVNELGITRKFDLIGASFGGATAVNFTASYSDRVDRLVIIAPIVKDYEVPGIFKVPVVGEFAARFVGIRTVIDRFEALIAGHPDAERYTSMFVEQTTYEGFQQSLLSMLRSDALGDYTNAYRVLGQQNRQILLVWGTADAEITQNMMDDVRSLIPTLTFEPIDGAGHGLFIQAPDTVNPLVLDFLLSE